MITTPEVFLAVTAAYGLFLTYGLRVVLLGIEDVPAGRTIRQDAAEITAFLRGLRAPRLRLRWRSRTRPRRTAPPSRPAGRHRKTAAAA